MRKLIILICFLTSMVNIVYAEPIFKKDSTSKLIEVFISSSASTTGGGLTGLVYNSSGLTAYYYCSGTTATSITLATMTVGTWATGGFKEIDSTNMPGWYQFGIPNAAIASGCGDDVNIHLKGATNMVPLPFAISLVDNLESDTYAKVDTEVASILDDTGTSGVLISDGTGAGQLALTSGAVDTCTAVTNGVSLQSDAITPSSIQAGALGGASETYLATGTENASQTSTATRVYTAISNNTRRYMSMCLENGTTLERSKIVGYGSSPANYYDVRGFSAAVGDSVTLNVHTTGCQ